MKFHLEELTQGVEDLDNDEEVGFKLISTDDIDDYGITEIIRRIRDRIGDSPVYLRSASLYTQRVNDIHMLLG